MEFCHFFKKIIDIRKLNKQVCTFNRKWLDVDSISYTYYNQSVMLF